MFVHFYRHVICGQATKTVVYGVWWQSDGSPQGLQSMCNVLFGLWYVLKGHVVVQVVQANTYISHAAKRHEIGVVFVHKREAKLSVEATQGLQVMLVASRQRCLTAQVAHGRGDAREGRTRARKGTVNKRLEDFGIQVVCTGGAVGPIVQCVLACVDNAINSVCAP